MSIDWTSLEKKSPLKLLSQLRSRLNKGESFQLTSEQLATEADCTEKQARAALETLAKQGVLKKESQSVCHCGQVLTQRELNNKVCSNCNSAFSDYSPPSPIVKEIYSFEGSQTRDVRWVLVLHGMNTRGAWQERFSWLLSRVYGYSVPVAIYKYGMVRPGVLFRFRMTASTTKLIEKISILSREAHSDGFGGAPDVVAHSFGTWLIGHALQADKNLKVGRVILLGSILRPDFDWENLVKRGQVQAVMCHRATGDLPVAITQYVIPDSGPSGRQGFNSPCVIEDVSQGLGHSGFFEEGQMVGFYNNLWQPFLTRPDNIKRGSARNWHPVNWLLNALLFRYLTILVLLALAICLCAIVCLGSIGLWQRLIS